MIQVRYLDGKRFKRIIQASASHLSSKKNDLNKINVFPVPDGDTGTNMSFTMQHIAASAQNCHHNGLGPVSDAIALSALDGARGNSGAILAQFFQGFAEATEGKLRVNTKAFANAMASAVEKAKTAISNPVEGTIITVMREWAEHLAQFAHQKIDFAELLSDSLKKASEALAETPNKLRILKKSGVVDAGAQGFVHMIEGVVEFIDKGKMAAIEAGAKIANARYYNLQKISPEMKFQFCTECLIAGDQIDHSGLRQQLGTKGDSLIIVGSKQRTKIHIHTNAPEDIFAIAKSYGTLLETKIDDMHRQHQEIILQTKNSIGIVTDSTCDLPEEVLEKNNISVVPVILQKNEKSYLDRVELQPQDFYQMMMKNPSLHFSTSQPPIRAFTKLYDKVARDYEKIISIHIAEKLSGTINGARMAAAEGKNSASIHIIDSKTTSASLGLLVNEIAEMAANGWDHAAILEEIKNLLPNVRLFISVPTLDRIIQSGRISKISGLIGKMFRVKPVLTLNSEGRAVVAQKVIGQKNVEKKTLQLAIRFARKFHNPKFSIVHAMAPQLASFYKNELEKHFHTNNIFTTDASPALVVHTGIGSAAIAVLGKD